MTLTTDEKAALLMELTRGPAAVYALRSTRTDQEEFWRPVYAPLSTQVVKMHLSGRVEIGNYALLPERPMPKTCWVAADFDGKKPGVEWKNDVKRATQFLVSSGANVFVNLSRSAKGAHVRVLFKEPVPAWLARRWMMAWLEEAEVVLKDPETWDKAPPSFDLLVPRQDVLSTVGTAGGNPNPGNLVGAPLSGTRVTKFGGGTLPLCLEDVLDGRFEPDGRHWEHVQRALDRRAWGEAELRQALRDAPGDIDTATPDSSRYYDAEGKLRLPMMSGGSAELNFVVQQCRFFEYMRASDQPYHLWVAMASQLHAFGEAGREMFHEISALDPRYDSDAVEQKWNHTATMHPVRCDTLVQWGYRCRHLDDNRCGTTVPANLARASRCELV
jgi:hypothetical protein